MFTIPALLLLWQVGDALKSQRMAEVFFSVLFFNMLLPMMLMVIYSYAIPVFFAEKQQKTMDMLLCSPAKLKEIFLGKAITLSMIALLPLLVLFFAIFGMMSHMLFNILFDWQNLIALLMSFLLSIAYGVIIGGIAMYVNDWRIPNVVISMLAMAQFFTIKYTKTLISGGGMNELLLQYGALTVALVIGAGAIYKICFSKSRLMDPV
jgi:ABC-type Na+ efflux pump permease subunit